MIVTVLCDRDRGYVLRFVSPAGPEATRPGDTTAVHELHRTAQHSTVWDSTSQLQELHSQLLMSCSCKLITSRVILVECTSVPASARPRKAAGATFDQRWRASTVGSSPQRGVCAMFPHDGAAERTRRPLRSSSHSHLDSRAPPAGDGGQGRAAAPGTGQRRRRPLCVPHAAAGSKLKVRCGGVSGAQAPAAALPALNPPSAERGSWSQRARLRRGAARPQLSPSLALPPRPLTSRNATLSLLAAARRH